MEETVLKHQSVRINLAYLKQSGFYSASKLLCSSFFILKKKIKKNINAWERFWPRGGDLPFALLKLVTKRHD